MAKGWTMPVQQASYRGVRFDVLSVDDNIERATIEHAYPFVNGADIEDLGLNPLTVSMQAVFYGEGYYTNYKKFLSELNKQGSAVLMHPVRGRLQNMICASAYFRHEAEFVDYVTIDLMFKEATPAKPIFVFNNAFLALLDEILTDIENFIDDVMALWGDVMESIALVQNVKSRVLGMWGAISGIYGQIRDLVGADKTKYSVAASVGLATINAQSGRAVRDMGEMINGEIIAMSQRADLSVKARFDEALRTANTFRQLPANLISGKNQRTQSSLKSLTSALSERDVQEVDLAVKLFCAGALMTAASQIIEHDSETLTPVDIDYLATQVRLQILTALNQLRRLQQDEQAQAAATAPTTGLYSGLAKTAERLRKSAHQINQLALATINRKPPLMLRVAEFNGTIQQHAHAIYGDYTRADEILRLNPHIREPNFIARGTSLNSYAK